jgi:hypothetical protein
VQSTRTLYQDGLFRGLVVQSEVNGQSLEQVILVHKDYTEHEYPEWDIRFSGHFAIISFNGEGELLNAYIGEGRRLQIGNRMIESTGSSFLSNYAVWASTNAQSAGNNPAADEDGDGVANCLEYVLGGLASKNDASKLPVVSAAGGDFVFSFARAHASIDGSTDLQILVSPDLTDWSVSYPVPDGATSNEPGLTVVKDFPVGFDTVTLTLPLVPDVRKFARLKVAP